MSCFLLSKFKQIDLLCCKSVFIYSCLLVTSSPEVTVCLSLPMWLIDAKRDSLLVLINCTNNIKITVTGTSIYAKCTYTYSKFNRTVQSQCNQCIFKCILKVPFQLTKLTLYHCTSNLHLPDPACIINPSQNC